MDHQEVMTLRWPEGFGRTLIEDRREKLAYVRHLFDLLQEVAEQHFKLGGTHADKGALNCDCVLAKSHQKTRAEWFTCSEALRRPAPPDSGDKKEAERG